MKSSLKALPAIVFVVAALSIGPLYVVRALGQPAASATAHDGRNDWAFEYGTWRTHYRVLRHRLVNDHEWYSCEGTSVILPFWNGNGNLEDGDLACPKRRVGGMTLRLYNPATHQWSLLWGTRKLGLVFTPQVGE